MSPLLSLPGEIRNMIFKLVLSEPDGVEFVKDHSGNGWLCLNVRDQNAVSVAHPDTAIYTVKNGRVIANQLQFVCRQLRQETNTFGVLYNTIAFNYPDPSLISAFLDGLPSCLQHQPHNLSLRESPHEKGENYCLGLTTIFQKYPRCTLKFHHPQLVSSRPYWILVTSLVLGYTVRNEVSFVKKLSNSVDVQQLLLEPLGREVDFSTGLFLLRDLAIFPHEDVLNEDEFRAACQEHRIIRDMLIPTLKNGLDDLVVVAREVYTNGF
jgi:hypothetical protein